MGDPGVNYRDIPNFPAFRVGDDGSVWSCLERYWEEGHRGSKSRMTNDWHKLNVHVCKVTGYCLVTLRNDERQWTPKVHTLVLNAFVGPKPKGMVARHFPDRDRTNNKLNNLSWGTPQDNSDDMAVHGTVLKGEDNANSKLSEEEVMRLLSDREAGATLEELSDAYNISTSMASLICRKENWKHLHE